jgi:Bacterial Ig domain
MSTPPPAHRGNVVSIWGKAYIRGTDGVWRPLKLGDVVKADDALRTDQDSIVLMVRPPAPPPVPTAAAAPRPLALPESESTRLEEALRVERIVERVIPAEVLTQLEPRPLNFGSSNPTGTASAGAAAELPPLRAPLSSISALEAGGAVPLGLFAPSRGAITVTELPTLGLIVKADGSAVMPGSTLTAAELAGLRYLPPADYDGSAPVGAFRFELSDGRSSAVGGTTIALAAVNDAPVARDDAATTYAGTPVRVDVRANDSDIDGPAPLAVTAASVNPAQGSVTINADGTLSFTSAPGFVGNALVSYNVSDGGGGTASATLTVAVAPALQLTVDVPALGRDTTPRVAGTSNLPPGTVLTITVTDANGAAQTFNATVQPGGGWAADVPNPLPDGPFTATASATLPDGASASGSDSGVIDTTPPALTVDAPALGNDSTPAIVGTTDLPAGSIVTLTVTDANGAVQTFSATV